MDYIGKPFDREELLARIRTHLTLREQELKLRHYAEHLGQMVEERTRPLVHADRLATLGTLVAALAHEVNNPLQGLMGNAEPWQMNLEVIRENLFPFPDREQEDRLWEMVEKLGLNLRDITRCGEQIAQLISQFRGYGRKGSEARNILDLNEPIRDALFLMSRRLKQKAEVAVEVRDNGPGIPAELEQRNFEPIITSKGEKGGTGLGLFVVQTIIEEHQGHISLVPHEGPGAWFRNVLPRPPETNLSKQSAGAGELKHPTQFLIKI